MATGGRNKQTGRAGEYFVAAELCRRGAYAVTFAGNMANIDILASNDEQTRTVNIQVSFKGTSRLSGHPIDRWQGIWWGVQRPDGSHPDETHGLSVQQSPISNLCRLRYD